MRPGWKMALAFMAALVSRAASWAQTAPLPLLPAPGSIEGLVLANDSGRPLKRAHIILRPAEAGLAGLGTTTDESGRFVLDRVPPGRYFFSTERPGYLPAGFARRGLTRLPVVFPLLPGEHLDGLVFRLQPAGVIAGKVKFDDADPAIGVDVVLYRRYFYRGRHAYSVAGRTSTDDRGDYRIHGLPPGSYYVAAAYMPPVASGILDQPRLDAEGKPAPEQNYVTTFHPSVHRLMEAVPVALGYGSEISSTDIFLERVRTVRVRGRVTSGLTGRPLRSAAIRLWRPDISGQASIEMQATVRPYGEEEFEITGLTPGSYQVVVDASEQGKRLSTRLPLTVSEAPLDTLEIMLLPERELSGKVRVDDGSSEVPLSGLRVSLEPRGETAPVSSASVTEDGSFSAPVVAGETYDVFVVSTPQDTYLKSALLGTFDVLSRGMRMFRDAPGVIEITLGANGAQVHGQVAAGATQAALGARVMLVPDPARGRPQFYHGTTTDQYGMFLFRGVAPGRYTVFAWWDDPPCEMYDPDEVARCRHYGKDIAVAEGGRADVSLMLSPPPEAQ